jgi:hypothetical protein
MEVIQEKLDREIFIDIVLNEKEIEEVIKGEMISVEFSLGRESVSLGIRKPIPEESYAAEKRKVQKNNKRKYF